MTPDPVGWRLVTLNDLQADEPRAITDGPFGSNLTSAHYTDSGPRVVRLQNIGDGVFHDLPARISEAHFQVLRAHEVLAGDLLVASLGETLPRACLAPANLGPAIVKADCIRVRLSQKVDNRWVMYAMQRPKVRKWADEHRHGVGRPRLGLKVIRQIPVPLPPLDEQRRIVDILEDHLSRLDAGERAIIDAIKRQRSLRASVLQSSHVGPTVSLGGLSIDAGYGTSTKCDYHGPGLPVVRIPNVVDGKVDLSDQKRALDESVDLSGMMLAEGDLLIVRTNGSRDLIGRTAVVQSGVTAAFASYLIRFKIDRTRARPEWVQLMLEAPKSRRVLEGMAASSAGQYNLGLKKLNTVEVPCPSISEQERMLAVAAGFEWSSRSVAQYIEKARQRSTALRRALLDAAFSGRLTGRASDMNRVEEMASV
ncbi:restriction endonuclease subunit S [Micromonospora tarensis]|uniref:Restriction endonuclease subunit S n=1 Tax=Micromonospora tarensis TaxID=2806100 RepID=A0ABS1YEC3_9ACTN|nr:restriction endonuclease subunit S [Micromonospora tarensis]MBM0275748.1 restriction endonuclease subunit S [Micromonospora tarensis]